MGMPVPCAGYLSSFKFPLKNLKLLRYLAQGTGIPIIVRENKLFIL
jgi:hypothetical protein